MAGSPEPPPLFTFEDIIGLLEAFEAQDIHLFNERMAELVAEPLRTAEVCTVLLAHGVANGTLTAERMKRSMGRAYGWMME